MEAHNNPVPIHITPTSPYYIGANDSSGTSLVPAILTGPNYYLWKRAIEISLGSKNKLGFINGTLACPNEGDPLFGNWKQCNLIVMGWILNSVSAEIRNSILYCETGSKMWKELYERFSLSNEARLYELYQNLHNTKQGGSTISEYFTLLETIWNDITIQNPLPRCQCGVVANCTCAFMEAFVAREHKKFKIIFLMGLNESYSAARGQILLMKPLPHINEI